MGGNKSLYIHREINSVVASVIVPFYNAQEYIAKCLKSLCEQDLTSYEIICIDDGSLDSSCNIVKALQKLYSNIRLLQQDHKGVSAARNLGIQNAEGKYLIFVDADDTIKKNTLRLVLNKIITENADILVFGGKTNHRFHTPLWIREAFTTKNRVYKPFDINALLGEYGARPSVCNKVWKKELFNNIEFSEQLSLGEDHMILFLLFPKAQKIIFIKNRLYCYHLDNPNSATSYVEDDLISKINQHLNVVTTVGDYWNENNYMDKWKTEYLGWVMDFLKGDFDKLGITEKENFLVEFKNRFNWLNIIEKKNLLNCLLKQESKEIKKSLFFNRIEFIIILLKQFGWSSGLEAIISRFIFKFKK